MYVINVKLTFQPSSIELLLHFNPFSYKLILILKCVKILYSKNLSLKLNCIEKLNSIFGRTHFFLWNRDLCPNLVAYSFTLHLRGMGDWWKLSTIWSWVFFLFQDLNSGFFRMCLLFISNMREKVVRSIMQGKDFFWFTWAMIEILQLVSLCV